MRLQNQSVLSVVLFMFLLFYAGPVLAQDGSGASVPSQGFVQVGGLGGLTRALVALDDGGALLAEGDALLHLDQTGAVLNRAALGRGQIQDVVVQGQFIYAMTEEGLVTAGRDTLAARAFRPGGGQAVVVTNSHIYGAAQSAGLRVAALDRQGLPGDWRQVITPGSVHDLAVDETGATLYAALGEFGINAYDLTAGAGAQLAGTISDIGRVDVVRVVGDRLLVGGSHRSLAAGGVQLQVFDLSVNRFLPSLVQTYAPLHDAQDVILRQDWAYIADQAGGLKRYAIGDLYAPQVDSVLWEGTAYGLAEDARYLYVAAGWGGVRIFDAGLPDTITQRGWAALPGEALAVAVVDDSDGRWGVAAMGTAGLAVLDLLDVDRPQVVAVLELPGSVQAVALRGTLGLAGLDTGAVVVFSIADRANPRVVATLPLPTGTPLDFTWDDTLVYVAAGSGGLVVLDLIRPAAPVLVGTLEPGRGGQSYLDVAVEGNGSKRAYISTGEALVIVDVAAPDDLHILAESSIPARAAVARNFITYVVGGSTVTTINAASSNAPTQLGAAPAVGQIQDVTAAGGLIWVVGDESGALAEGLAAGADGRLLPVLAVDERGRALAVARSTGSSVLVAGEAGAIWRVDRSGQALLREGVNPGAVLAALDEGQLLVGGETWQQLAVAQPDGLQLLAEGSSPGPVLDIAGDAQRVYLALGAAGIITGDGAQRWRPQAGAGAVRAVSVDGAYLWAAEGAGDQTGALRVLAADRLQSITTVPLPGPATAVSADEGRVYAGYGDGSGGGLAVVAGRAPTGGLHQVAAVTGRATDVVVLPDGSTGYAVNGDVLRIFALDDPVQLTPGRTVTLPHRVERLTLVEAVGRRYLVGWQPGEALLVLDLSDPTLPRPVAAMPTRAVAVTAVADVLFLAEGAGGLTQLSLATLADLAGRVRPVDGAHPVALWQAGDRLYAAGADGDLRVYDVSTPTMPELVATASGVTGAAVRGLVGRSTRRDGVWLYLAAADAVQVWQHAPDGTLTRRATWELQTRQLLAMTDHHLYYRGADRTLHVAGLAHSTALAWDFAFPGLAGQPRAVISRQENVLVSTTAGLARLAWLDEAVPPPAVIGLVDDLPGPVAQIIPADEGLLWVGGTDYLARIDVNEPEAPVVLEVMAVSGGLEGVALLQGADLLAVGTAACGVRLWDVSGAARREVGYWQAPGVRDVADLGAALAVLGADGLTLLRPNLDAPPVLPAVPYAPDPPDNARVSEGSITLSWAIALDPCAAVSAEVWVSVAEGDATLAATTTDQQVVISDLPLGAVITWQVRVVDGQGDAAWGPIWHFMTGPADDSDPTPAASPAAWASLTPGDLPDQGAIGSPAVEFFPGTNWRAYVPLLALGLALEVGLVLGLVAWWRWRRKRW